MYSAYKLNKQGDSIQPWRIPFPIWNQSVVPCPVLTVASWHAYWFLKRQVCESAALNMPANLENSGVATGWEKVSFHYNPKERQCQRMLKLLHNCTHLTPSKVMLKILQARLQQYMNHELPDVQAGFRKAEEQEIKLPTSTGSLKKQESSRKTSISALLSMPKPLTVWITINCGNISLPIFNF